MSVHKETPHFTSLNGLYVLLLGHCSHKIMRYFSNNLQLGGYKNTKH